MIKDGAYPVTEATDILAVLWPDRSGGNPARESASFEAGLTEPVRAVLSALGRQPLHVDELAGGLGLTAGELSAILLHLEQQRRVAQLPGSRFVRV